MVTRRRLRLIQICIDLQSLWEGFPSDRLTRVVLPRLDLTLGQFGLVVLTISVYQSMDGASPTPAQSGAEIPLQDRTHRPHEQSKSASSNGTPVLPDPTSDLHWSEFRGAIHDIFAANAEAHPDRLCVVETASETNPRREFSYRQINEASNILAHHLVASGVQRGEVVMVYAYRGVDLVVAVMGVLKAGATFSVIDPAYPPDRQIIYLEVAQPRALVVIEKATKEAGSLADKVRSYIKKSLHLRTEVPGLLIQDDGALLGGPSDGKDILSPQMILGAKSLGITVGPDSTPTLSFTSGSEGRPKGVRGRHFSLAYYFPWMSERFQLSRDDRFTMLSGIAHDPIQRDIFTPLFLGAHLLVPSKENIQHERLAEWMREHGATVTHLTPAMGQILVGGASAEFPALHHAFFVGDILIKRDCMMLQRLAPNVNIVNMYGTTETQRAVSFFEIPCKRQDPTFLNSMKDVIPAGRGMYDVQLLVVNTADHTKMCEVGEVGEIYVRAGGLAEGYLGDPVLSAKKFLQNWFVDPEKWIELDRRRVQERGAEEPWRAYYLGPRDRLYRSGDLGRYLPSGDVECTGRADDQVKIRGFRIELGEINKHLSDHPLVRERITLVRRDKDEEPTLVSYIVPEMSQWPSWLKEKGLVDRSEEEGMIGMLRRFRHLREDIRTVLKTKLPSYAVPSVVIPLMRMPLNPNGKIDKPALPFPDVAELAAAAPRRTSTTSSPLSPTESKIASIWAGLIPSVHAETLSPADSFFDIGGHSILAQMMILRVKREWKDAGVSMTSIFRSPTLRGFAHEVEGASSSGDLLNGANGTVANASGQMNNLNRLTEEEYARDAQELAKNLPVSFPKHQDHHPVWSAATRTVFLTGVTGFLGAFILKDLLTRTSPSVKVIALVRERKSSSPLDRIRDTCQAYGIWSDSWASKIEGVTGNLGEQRLGMEETTWQRITDEVDVVIHNGAQVHWVLPYSNLKAPNVQGTIDALALCSAGRPKRFAFVSSTSVLDTDYYVQLSERSIRSGGKGVSEDDDLQGSREGLGTGYGQSKWVSEYLVREAGRRGLSGSIIRPGYVTGDSKTGGE